MKVDKAVLMINGVPLGECVDTEINLLEGKEEFPDYIKNHRCSGSVTLKVKKRSIKKMHRALFPKREIRKYFCGIYRFIPWFLVPKDIINFATIDWFQAERVEK